MRLPQGWNETSGRVVRLARSIYDLKQAGQYWHSLLVQQLEGSGMEQCPADPCMLRIIGNHGHIRMMLATHVDNMIIAGSSTDRDRLHECLNECFQTKKKNGNLTHDTGGSLKRERRKDSIVVSQEACIDRVLERFKLTMTSPVPAAPYLGTSCREELQPTKESCREAVGALMWLSNMSPPDIVKVVRSVAHRAHDSTPEDWKDVTKILGYVRGTRTLASV